MPKLNLAPPAGGRANCRWLLLALVLPQAAAAAEPDCTAVAAALAGGDRRAAEARFQPGADTPADPRCAVLVAAQLIQDAGGKAGRPARRWIDLAWQFADPLARTSFVDILFHRIAYLPAEPAAADIDDLRRRDSARLEQALGIRDPNYRPRLAPVSPVSPRPQVPSQPTAGAPPAASSAHPPRGAAPPEALPGDLFAPLSRRGSPQEPDGASPAPTPDAEPMAPEPELVPVLTLSPSVGSTPVKPPAPLAPASPGASAPPPNVPLAPSAGSAPVQSPAPLAPMSPGTSARPSVPLSPSVGPVPDQPPAPLAPTSPGTSAPPPNVAQPLPSPDQLAAEVRALLDRDQLAEADAALAQALSLAPADATLALLAAELAGRQQTRGLTDAQRRRLQRALSLSGFDTGGVDGVLGENTQAAARRWQERAGLPATGWLSEAERTRLLDEAAAALTNWDQQQAAAPRRPAHRPRPAPRSTAHRSQKPPRKPAPAAPALPPGRVRCIGPGGTAIADAASCQRAGGRVSR